MKKLQIHQKRVLRKKFGLVADCFNLAVDGDKGGTIWDNYKIILGPL